MPDLKPVINFLFEVGSLSKNPRSGFHILGTGHQSVAEHTNRAVFIGYALAMLVIESLDQRRGMVLPKSQMRPAGQ